MLAGGGPLLHTNPKSDFFSERNQHYSCIVYRSICEKGRLLIIMNDCWFARTAAAAPAVSRTPISASAEQVREK
jgi:hypothetical protein